MGDSEAVAAKAATPEGQATATVIVEDPSAPTPDLGDFKPLFDTEPVFSREQLEKHDEEAGKVDADKAKADADKAKADADKAKADADKAKADKATEDPEAKAKAEAESAKAKTATDKERNLTAALHEERMKRKELSGEVEQLKAEVAELKAGKKDGGDAKKEGADSDQFKVLSDEEYEALVEEDPAQALIYMNRLRRYEKAEASRANEDSRVDGAIRAAASRMAQAVPGLFDDDKKVASDLVKFASDNGLSQDSLALITDPGTRIVVRDKDGRFKSATPLGDAAAELTEFIYKLRKGVPQTDRKAVEAEVRAELEKEYKTKQEEFEQKILAKFKENPSTAYRDLASAPGASESVQGGALSEAALSRLSPEEQRKYLGG